MVDSCSILLCGSVLICVNLRDWPWNVRWLAAGLLVRSAAVVVVGRHRATRINEIDESREATAMNCTSRSNVCGGGGGGAGLRYTDAADSSR